MNTTPRLSPSLALDVLACPLKAWTRHRLLGGLDTEKTPAMLEGSLLEVLICDAGHEKVAVIDAPDFRTKDAQTQKAAALDAGQVPVIREKYEAAKATADIIREKIYARAPRFINAANQVRLEWTSSDCDCSGVLDRLFVDTDSFIIYDLKKTECADPAKLERKITQYGYHVQHASYLEAVNSMYPQLAGRGAFEFIFYETEPPYCVTVARLDGALEKIGEFHWGEAKRIWRGCIEQNEWREYTRGDEVAILEATSWDIAQMGGAI